MCNQTQRFVYFLFCFHRQRATRAYTSCIDKKFNKKNPHCNLVKISVRIWVSSQNYILLPITFFNFDLCLFRSNISYSFFYTPMSKASRRVYVNLTRKDFIQPYIESTWHLFVTLLKVVIWQLFVLIDLSTDSVRNRQSEDQRIAPLT